jgi:hypothetical protein
VCLNGIFVVQIFRHDLSEIIRESIDYGLAHRDEAVRHSLGYDMGAKITG